MHRDRNHRHPRSLFFAGALALALVFVLSACGTNTTTGSQRGNTGITPAPTATQHQANANGCPNGAAPAAASPASVILTNKDSNKTVSVTRGETIEVHLSFGLSWSGPAKLSQNLLTLQSPAGYTSSTANACVWRFVATGAGTAQLSFVGRPICKKGQMCPMYILAMPFTIEIK